MEEKTKKRASDKLIAALTDWDWQIRKTAASVLGMIGDDRTVVPLINALKDKEQTVRSAIVEALGSIGDERAKEPLMDLLKNGNQKHGTKLRRFIMGAKTEMSLRYTALHALGRIDPLLLKDNEECLKQYPDLFCSDCFRRTVKIENPVFKFGKKPFVICPECCTSTHLMTGAVHVIGVIGGGIKAPLQEETILKVPVWNEFEKTARFADVDSLLITRGAENYLLAVNAVILCFAEDSRKTVRMKKIPVHIEENMDLPAAVISMVKDNFTLKSSR